MNAVITPARSPQRREAREQIAAMRIRHVKQPQDDGLKMNLTWWVCVRPPKPYAGSMPAADPSRQHPPAPIILEWSLNVAATVEAVWREVSDTDRFNRVAGMDFEYTRIRGPDDTTRRVGTVRRFGMSLRWEEYAFDFEAPRRYRIDRRFLNGPLKRYVVSLFLTPDGPRTRLEYEIHAWPRSILTRPLMEIEFRGAVRRQLDRMWRTLVQHIEAGGGELEPPVGPLDPESRHALEDGLAHVSPPEVARALGRYVLEAPLAQQMRMRPLELARSWGVTEDAAVEGFLTAVRAGILTMRWDLLCPSCLGPEAQLTDLTAEAGRVHCDSCNITYDASIADALEISFRPAASLRDVEQQIRCVGSPARTPHILARGRLEPGEELEWEVTLPPGTYRLRVLSSMEAATLVIEEGAPALGLAVDIAPEGVQPVLLRASPGSVKMAIRSRLKTGDWFVLERRWRARDTLTAGRLLERPDAQGLLPEDALVAGLHVQVTRQSVMVTEALKDHAASLERVRTFLACLEPRCSYLTDRTLISTWPSPGPMLEAAARLEGALRLCNAAHVGPVVELTVNGQLVPTGSAVDEGRVALQSGLPGRTVVSASTASMAELKDALDEVSGTTELVPGPSVDGRDYFLLPLEESLSAPSQLVRPLDLPPEVDLTGRLFRDRFLLGEVVGQGGGGTVYAAVDNTTDQPVVVKVLRTKYASLPWHLQRFFAEARISLALSHPNVVNVMGFGHSEEGYFYLAMERLDGRELTDEIRSHGPLPPWRACDITVALLAGLEAAHAQGLVHRDIKPANVFLARAADGTELVKLIDFGVAVDMGLAPDPTEAGLLIGTIRYMAPELFRGQAADHRSDLYGVGLVLYTSLTAKAPFHDVPATALVVRRLHLSKPELAAECDQPYPQRLGEIVERCLEDDPSRRYPDARAMRLDLEDLLGDIEDTSVGVTPLRDAGSAQALAAVPTVLQDAPTEISDPDFTQEGTPR